ncbi:CPBP family intramembrane glutamic endopeptidase [Robertkochia flava]|uniref:CPBP family intramembrane glutamic endopeptidase n=1 Tax=Robertkochia flava TaxID=3447986 RepID=UPI001CCA3412|nr:CPBP family intramembrane glutamic endopeptidase [Robertkochia marina]
MANVILIGIVLLSLMLGWQFRLENDFLGLRPGALRTLDLLVGFVASAVACALCFLLLIWFTDARINANSYSGNLFFNAFWWTLRSVLTEELIFRGILLVLLIRYLGIPRACVVSSVAFGLYHWGSYGVFGDLSRMAEVFVLTAVGGLMFAFAFALTKSLYLPIGLHLGWNLVSVVVFSEGPLGMQWLEVVPRNDLSTLMTVLIFTYQVTVLPVIAYVYLKNRANLLL